MMQCNLCGGSQFIDFNTRVGVRCAACNSLERTRLLWMHIQTLSLQPQQSVLHIAPEQGIHDRLQAMLDPGHYVTADFDPSLYPFAPYCRRIDLTALDDWPDAEFDLILHVHVLEHIPCNIAYPIYHLHRMLKPGGLHMFVIPILGEVYEESLDAIGDAERERRFGQFDHMRRFGPAGIAPQLGSLLRLPSELNIAERFGEAALREANIPESYWQGYHAGTVFEARREDYRLARWPDANQATNPAA